MVEGRMCSPTGLTSSITALSTSPLTALSSSLAPSDTHTPSRDLLSTSPLTPAALTSPGSRPAFSTPASPTQEPGSPGRRRRRRHTTQQKLDIVIGELGKLRWGVKDFLSALIQMRGRHTVRVQQKQFLDFAYINFPGHGDFDTIVGALRRDRFFQARGLPWAAEILRLEIKALGEDSAFAAFVPPSESAELGSLEPLKDAASTIKRLAPCWLEVIERCRHETRPRDPVATAAAEPLPTERTVLMLASLCHLMRPIKSTNIQTIMGLYMYQGGCRRRVLDTMQRLGLIISYDTLQRRMKSLTDEAQRQVQLVGRAPNCILTWDNFEFTEGRRGERTGDRAAFRSITTALVFEGRGFDGNQLRPQMWHPETTLLSARGIAKSLQRDAVTASVSMPVQLFY